MTPAQIRVLVTNIEKPAGAEGCWLWRGGVNTSGYSGNLAHRAMYTLLVGEIPHGMQLDHLCRVRTCVNPHHLEIVTRAENQRRMRVRGPFKPLEFCRRGHPLVGLNRKLWTSRGKKVVHCYLCHDRVTATNVLSRITPSVEVSTTIQIRRTA